MAPRQDREYLDFMLGAGGDYRKPLSESKAIDEIIADLQVGRTRTAINKLRILKRQVGGGFHRNPPSSDVDIMFGQQVLAVEYIHADDGIAYRHEFGKGVRLFANRDGTLALEHVP